MAKKESAKMSKGEKKYEKITRRVKIYLSLDPPKVIVGTVTIPSFKTRLSDLLNDEKTFLPLQEVSVPDGGLTFDANFVLLSKNEIKALIELP